MRVLRENDNIPDFELKLVEKENCSFLIKLMIFSTQVLIIIHMG